MRRFLLRLAPYFPLPHESCSFVDFTCMAFVEVELSPAQPPTEKSFVSSLCLPFLRAAQDEGGGWGFHPGFQRSVEATSGALFALLGLESSNEMQDGQIPSRGGTLRGHLYAEKIERLGETIAGVRIHFAMVKEFNKLKDPGFEEWN
jgi:hypothetical protein